MTVTKIETPRDFFDHVVEVDVSEFRANRLDLRAAYHACSSLLSLRDWVVESYKCKPWIFGGLAQKQFVRVGELQTSLEAIEPKFAIVTDIANASKHMVLDPKRRRTNLHGNANTEVHGFSSPSAARFSGGISGAPISALPISGGPGHVLVKIDHDFHDVEACILAVHSAWTRILIENSW
jgi:hypothetical protein